MDRTRAAMLNMCRHWGRARRADSVEAYAHKVLVHAYLNHRKKYRRDAERALDFTRQVEAANGTAPAPAGRSELRLALLDALAQLAPRGRAVLVLRFWRMLYPMFDDDPNDEPTTRSGSGACSPRPSSTSRR